MDALPEAVQSIGGDAICQVVSSQQNNLNGGNHCEKQRRIFDPPLSTQRYQWIQNYLSEHPTIKKITDFGCGNGRMLCWLKSVPHLNLVNCVDSDLALLEHELDRYFCPGLCEMLFGRQSSIEPLKIRVYHGDLVIQDKRLDADCFTMVELIEHLPLEHLETATATVFGSYKPKHVLVTTPNKEFNHLLRQTGTDTANEFRHFDHKFEWNRSEFTHWANEICKKYSYEVAFDGVGSLPESKPFGPCTQIAAFTRKLDIPGSDIHQDPLLNFTPNSNMLSNQRDISMHRIHMLIEHNLPGSNIEKPKYDQENASYDWSVLADN